VCILNAGEQLDIPSFFVQHFPFLLVEDFNDNKKKITKLGSKTFNLIEIPLKRHHYTNKH
jgi:hypothetical protein